MPNEWTDELVERACELVRTGLSGRQAAVVLSIETGRNITGNSLICKLNRAGLQSNFSNPARSGKTAPVKPPPSPVPEPYKPSLPFIAALSKPSILDTPEPYVAASIDRCDHGTETREPDRCKFILDNGDVCSHHASQGSWCEHHRRIVFLTPQESAKIMKALVSSITSTPID